ncbi:MULTISPECIES: 2-hydroxyacid dehydrogenase [unclassified Cupriavidus]|uniref:2-hydroxyacid dehydrogenase n=1 Tax=unclassified Cupriavidus TaxID=2640874 RepID=UPI001BFFDF01|nr:MULTISPECIES: 2-hydroxyacid dehydrogenase [unclassified Cupriavidus]MCA3188217.1 2-hydroxyacid dehydrogenase [Cupriavidus sp.]MCA3192018.1 2-hydroxyacid dehydrogenase [Cupriavidus sp.]MCA3197763.1 2-hydroxyacid dehydrogenase [Cupriavidus sp.]MCA3202815.1 2-hydroxyacid dehydrogenase [Cupriavidus sp.]MCA3207719.1 2-hydroxyacid dehydrogenase [Cupriavidus sp.]
MKPQILQLNPILIPAANDELASLYHVHKLFEIDDQDAWFAEHAASVQAVITGGHTGISRAMLERLPALKVVAVNGVGTDAVDLAYCRERRLPVTATIGALTEDVADLAIGLLIAACRNIAAGDRFVRDGQWERFPQPSAIPLARRFSGMRVGIVGMGRVGRAVATRAAAFGCPIRYTDLRAMDDLPHEFVADLVDLARQSDALVLCAAADKAEGIVNAAVLDALGPRGFLVNVARGRLVNEDDLTRAIEAGRIAGAGLDVFVDEPRVPLALRQSDRTTLQAHRASATWETREAMIRMVLDSVADGLAGKRPAMSLTT